MTDAEIFKLHIHVIRRKLTMLHINDSFRRSSITTVKRCLLWLISFRGLFTTFLARVLCQISILRQQSYDRESCGRRGRRKRWMNAKNSFAWGAAFQPILFDFQPLRVVLRLQLARRISKLLSLSDTH